MKKIAICAVAVVGLVCKVPAQDNGGSTTTQNTATITSGPWHLRRSTSDKVADRLWFIMDRTLKSTEMLTLKEMFNSMPGGDAHELRKAILNAIDECSKTGSGYSAWRSNSWDNRANVSDSQIYGYMKEGVGYRNHIVLGDWLSNATDSQMMAVSKLVRYGGWANSLWLSSGMESG